jgi:hypothetical protein
VRAVGTDVFGWDQPIPFLSQESGTITLFGLSIGVPTALLMVIVFEAWKSFPFAFLFILARLQAVPGDLEEAARVDGATPTQVFRHIILPQLMGVIALIAVLRFIWTFNAFDEIYLLTGGGAGTEVLATQAGLHVRWGIIGMLLENDVNVLDPPADYSYEPGYYAVFFSDPDGMKLEFVHVPLEGSRVYWQLFQALGLNPLERIDERVNGNT